MPVHKIRQGTKQPNLRNPEKKRVETLQLTNRDIVRNTERDVETTQLSNQIIQSETSSWAS